MNQNLKENLIPKGSSNMTLYIPTQFHSKSILEQLEISMDKQIDLLHFKRLDKAIDMMHWLNFTHRIREERFVVVNGPEDDFVVMLKATALEHGFTNITPGPLDYSELSFDQIEAIRTDEDPLKHWEEITGAFAVMNSEFLRFILKSKLPLEKLIRYELAIRGYDHDGKWIGFEEAQKLWLE